MDKKHQFNNDYPSVTRILDLLRKPGLEYWFKNNTLEFITTESNKGKEIGKDIHNTIQRFINTGTISVFSDYEEEVNTALKSFLLFKNVHSNIELSMSELALTSETYKYNGIIDCTARKGDKLIILDWKTGKCGSQKRPKIYDEYKYQVAAYVKLFNDSNVEQVEEAIVVSIAKDSPAFDCYVMNKEEIESHFNNVILPLLTIYKHKPKEKYEPRN